MADTPIGLGGKTLDFLFYAAVHELPDKDLQAFALPPCGIRRAIFDDDAGNRRVGMFDAGGETQGKVFVTTELGGGATRPRARPGS